MFYLKILHHRFSTFFGYRPLLIIFYIFKPLPTNHNTKFQTTRYNLLIPKGSTIPKLGTTSIFHSFFTLLLSLIISSVPLLHEISHYVPLFLILCSFASRHVLRNSTLRPTFTMAQVGMHALPCGQRHSEGAALTGIASTQ